MCSGRGMSGDVRCGGGRKRNPELRILCGKFYGLGKVAGNIEGDGVWWIVLRYFYLVYKIMVGVRDK